MYKNSFESTYEYGVECYNCHNIGHIAKYCKIKNTKEHKIETVGEDSNLSKNKKSKIKPKIKQVWKEK